MSAQYICCATERHMGEGDAGTLIQGGLPACAGALVSRYEQQMQTIYLDPPFSTGKCFEMKARAENAGESIWEWFLTAQGEMKFEHVVSRFFREDRHD